MLKSIPVAEVFILWVILVVGSNVSPMINSASNAYFDISESIEMRKLSYAIELYVGWSHE